MHRQQSMLPTAAAVLAVTFAFSPRRMPPSRNERSSHPMGRRPLDVLLTHVGGQCVHEARCGAGFPL